MIYCIWYPGGGFGHFINAVLTLHGKNFVRPINQNFEFDSAGTSHLLELVAPKYLYDPAEYDFVFDNQKSYAVLIDNGNHNESTRFLKFFPNSQVIKICYSDWSWPIVAQTMLVKTVPGRSLESELPLKNDWSTNADWAVREKYFLYLRDHNLRFKWQSTNSMHNLDVADISSYQRLRDKLTSFNIVTEDFESLWVQWFLANKKYVEPTLMVKKIIDSLDTSQNLDLSFITDTWTQAVLYYFIWLKYNIEVPHNDYSNWFTTTKDIVTMLNNHGVMH